MKSIPYLIRTRLTALTLSPVLINISLMLFGCFEEDLDNPHYQSLKISDHITLDQYRIALEETRSRAWIINTENHQLSTSVQPLSEPPWQTLTTHDKQRALILSPESRTLTLLTPQKETQTIEVASPYNQITLSKDDRYAIAWFQGSNQSIDELFNPNAYAVIDLESGAVKQRSLRSFGGGPREVIFVPPLTLEGRADPIRHALFLFDSYVTFAELSDDPYEITAQLRLSATDPSVLPEQVLFSEWDETSSRGGAGRFTYLIAQGSRDIYALSLLEEIDEQGTPRLKPNINQLPSGSRPEQMIRYRGVDDRDKLLVVNSGDQTLSVIDASTASVIQIPLNSPANHIYPYTSSNGEEFALIYHDEGATPMITFVQLAALEDRRGQALTQLALDSPIMTLIDSPIEGQAIGFYADRSGLSLIDLNQVFANPLRSNMSLKSWVLDRERAMIYASLEDSEKLTIIDLKSLQISSLELELSVESIHLFPETETLLLDHGEWIGSFTLMDTLQLDVNSSWFYQAVYLEGAIQ